MQAEEAHKERVRSRVAKGETLPDEPPLALLLLLLLRKPAILPVLLSNVFGEFAQNTRVIPSWSENKCDVVI